VSSGSRFGALVVALIVLTLGVGLTSPASARAAAPDTHKAVVTAPAEVVSATAVTSRVKVVSAALRSVSSLVAIELVALVAALTTVVAFSRWIGACWLRAPPRVMG